MTTALTSRKPARSSQYKVQVLDRTIAVLQAVADSGESPAAADIAGRVGLHKSTVHRLLVVLEHYGLLNRSPKGDYRVGRRAIELGDCALARLNLSDQARSILRDLARATGEGAHVTILSDTEMLSVAHVEGRWRLQSLTRTGHRTQIHCTAAGKAVLAFLPTKVSDDLIARLPFEKRTPRTIMKPSAFRRELARVRIAGFAIDDEEFEEGLRCVGAPIFDRRGHVIASISIAAPIFRLRKDRLAGIARIVMAAAARFSAELGTRNAGDSAQESRRRVSRFQ